MAELLGVVSGGAGLISLAIQLGDSALKLKRFYDNVRKAPQELEDLIFEIQTLGISLSEIDRTQHGQPGLPPDVMTGCRKWTQQIKEVADEMEKSIQKRRLLGAAKMALSRGRLNELCTKLERAKTLLMLAFQLYLSASLSSHGQMLARQVQQSREQTQLLGSMNGAVTQLPQQILLVVQENQRVPALEDPENMFLAVDEAQEPVGAEEQSQVRPRSQPFATKNRQSKPQYRLHFSNWFTCRTWELASTRGRDVWSVQIRTWNIRPDNAPIFKLCKAGDMAGVRKLIAGGEASVFDMDSSYKETTLHCAAESGNVDLCRYLLDNGAELGSRNCHWSPLGAYSIFGYKSDQDPTEMYRFFVEQASLDVDFDPTYDETPDWWSRAPNLDCLLIAQQSMSVPHSLRSLEERFNLSMSLDTIRHSAAMAIVQTIGSLESVRATVNFTDRYGHGLLHRLASILGHILLEDRTSSTHIDLSDWRSALRILIDASADLHLQHHNPFGAKETPLWNLPRSGPVNHHCGIQGWARELRACGVDLHEYGKKEHELWEAHPMKFLPCRYASSQQYRLMDFTYGPEPSDWCVTVAREVTVKQHELHRMPCAWQNDLVPRTICWKLTGREENEGCWKPVRELDLQSTAFAADDLGMEHDPKHEMFNAAQDDFDEVVRLARSVKREEDRQSCTPRSKSTSQMDLVEKQSCFARWGDRWNGNDRERDCESLREVSKNLQERILHPRAERRYRDVFWRREWL